MLKSILMGGAMLFAIPALAQTTGTNSGGMDSSASQTGTTSNDPEPMESNDQGTMATGTSTAGTHSGQTGTMSNGTMSNGTMSNGTMSDGTMSNGTMSNGTMGNGTMSNGTMGTGTTGSAAGEGGPFQAARNYPPCTRTRTDSCRQRGGR